MTKAPTQDYQRWAAFLSPHGSRCLSFVHVTFRAASSQLRHTNKRLEKYRTLMYGTAREGRDDAPKFPKPLESITTTAAAAVAYVLALLLIAIPRHDKRQLL